MNKWISDIIDGKLQLSAISDERLAKLCQILNDYYRQGNPLVSDEEYDFIYLKALSDRVPEHPFLHNVEPEDTLISTKKITLPQRMRSTDKAYSFSQIQSGLRE